ncbi:MAG TPA: hypothetical protein PLC82_10380 [Smithellaceae bacterium]|nr:hypothetical protein [Smithellaceae bacterium]
MQRKYNLDPKLVMALWLMVTTLGVVLPGVTIIIFVENILGDSGIVLDETDIAGLIVSLIVAFGIIFLWRKVTFNYDDFVQVIKRMGGRGVEEYGLLSRLLFSNRVFIGHIDDLYVAAIIDSPIFSFFPGGTSYAGIVVHSGNVPEYKVMEVMSQVTFFIPFQLPRGADLMIESSAGIVTIVRSNIPEICNPLLAIFKEIADFQGRIAFSKIGFSLTIIGGSWQGELFRKHIISGIEISKAVGKKFKEKYNVRSISEEDITWDLVAKVFRLKSGDILSVIENDSIKNNMGSPSIAVR